eukprot:gnl/Chilomastix_cuspidata/2049.p2 GENE.gnl/Chilomastix_cuspidata/2049~~gnl/Chilomastix_cuspidata/2049.p2  ORF type:complete len:238 (+),score=95.71 gnl/Chilomastix_cuspidata/2049:40-753(+)
MRSICNAKIMGSNPISGCFPGPNRNGRGASVSAQMAPGASSSLGERTVAEGRFLRFKVRSYRNANGEFEWEYFERTTREQTGADIDCVEIVPTISYPVSKRPKAVVLVRQFRPAFGAYTIEFPAGLVDARESACAAARRELAEETGYVADSAEVVSPIIPLGPAITTTVGRVVACGINGDSPENLAPAPAPEATEDIQTLVLPLDGLLARLEELHAGDTAVEGRLFMFALALARHGE